MPSSGSALNAFNSLRSLRCRQELSTSGPDCYKTPSLNVAKLYADRKYTKIHVRCFSVIVLQLCNETV